MRAATGTAAFATGSTGTSVSPCIDNLWPVRRLETRRRERDREGRREERVPYGQTISTSTVSLEHGVMRLNDVDKDPSHGMDDVEKLHVGGPVVGDDERVHRVKQVAPLGVTDSGGIRFSWRLAFRNRFKSCAAHFSSTYASSFFSFYTRLNRCPPRSLSQYLLSTLNRFPSTASPTIGNESHLGLSGCMCSRPHASIWFTNDIIIMHWCTLGKNELANYVFRYAILKKP